MTTQGLIIAGTGHRPNKLGGYGPGVIAKLFILAAEQLSQRRPDQVISGMALGWDFALAEAAQDLGLPLIAAVPFAGQERMWPEKTQKAYRQLLQYAEGNGRVEIVSPGGYSAQKMQVRNEWMVDNCNHVLALWNGSPGGTGNCMRYVARQQRTFDNVWPLYLAMWPEGWTP